MFFLQVFTLNQTLKQFGFYSTLILLKLLTSINNVIYSLKKNKLKNILFSSHVFVDLRFCFIIIKHYFNRIWLIDVEMIM